MSLSDLMKSYDFTGRTIVITGGTGVLCGAMAKSLVGCGANVAILARSVEKGEALLTEIRKDISGPGRALIVAGDVLDQETLQQATRRVLDEFGRIDGLINGAGGNSPQATTRPDLTFFNLPEDALRYVFDLNMLGTILPCQVFGRQMAEQGEGVILNVSSMSAVRPLTRVIGYSAAKAGINNFTQWLAVHLAQQYSPRLRVNAVAPGFFITEQNRALLTNPANGELTQRGQSIIAHTPMGRFGDPEDLLGAVLWLLSPASAFVTGIVVPVDGGFSAFGGV
ncbi:MAG TPA: SDR family oxidoreductase [Blastocatellia bacterium]|nr:SDR family oxidoreductase [Blastocatellia bacterium]HMV83084.1 SDR family oxidoreductase [Blastocatellia bacterium]HMY72835.1 SDR family oxidoreductase [Blastocatellia bacterium]HMZ18282.1 SDR family oxidoreductase [Blastocatellia bacterium]HNG30981.1 SDR family oxidoreductase [Blastocatellia bacterium]